jgi:uncharacterized integral membrane protein
MKIISDDVNNSLQAIIWLVILFQLLLIILKFTNVITCSWWLVLAPFFIPLIIGVMAVIIITLLLEDVVNEYEDWDG